MKKYVFDLDNTLIFTDTLNNISYNFSLKKMGLKEIKANYRITRKEVFEKYKDLTKYEKEKIESMKQEYFKQHLEKTSANLDLFKILKKTERENCILWTSASYKRVIPLLEYYDILLEFKEIIYSDKKNLEKDIERICKIFSCKKENLYFYEDSDDVINRLKDLKLNIEKIKQDYFIKVK